MPPPPDNHTFPPHPQSGTIGLEKKLDFLYKLPVTQHLANHIAEKTIEVVDKAFGGDRRTSAEHVAARKFKDFVWQIFSQVRIPATVLLTALHYMKRAGDVIGFEKEDEAFEQIFLGSLLVAYKYLMDDAPNNGEWVKSTGRPREELSRVERQFLGVINRDASVKAEDIAGLYEEVIEIFPKPKENRHSRRPKAVHHAPRYQPVYQDGVHYPPAVGQYYGYQPQVPILERPPPYGPIHIPPPYVQQIPAGQGHLQQRSMNHPIRSRGDHTKPGGRHGEPVIPENHRRTGKVHKPSRKPYKIASHRF